MSIRHLLNLRQFPGICPYLPHFTLGRKCPYRHFAFRIRMQCYTTNLFRENCSVCSKSHHIIMLPPSKSEGLETTISDFLRAILKANSSQILFHSLVFSQCNLELPDLTNAFIKIMHGFGDSVPDRKLHACC